MPGPPESMMNLPASVWRVLRTLAQEAREEADSRYRTPCDSSQSWTSGTLRNSRVSFHAASRIACSKLRLMLATAPSGLPIDSAAAPLTLHDATIEPSGRYSVNAYST